MEQPNKDLKIKIINKLMPIRFFIKGTIDKNVICCPFHSDRKPSAEIFENSNAVWCYTCRRFYYPINFIFKNKLNINEIYDKLQSFYEDENLVELYEKSQIDKQEEKQTPLFKKQNINIIDYTNSFFKK